MKQWRSMVFSCVGRRLDNQDFICIDRVKIKQRRTIDILLVCDGVGGKPYGRECAREIGGEIIRKVKLYFLKRKSRKTLQAHDKTRLVQILGSFSGLAAPQIGRTTATLLLIDRKGTKSGVSVICLWAGDSRAFCIGDKEPIFQITTDQYTPDGYLATVFGGDGQLYGNLGMTYLIIKKPVLCCITSDGMNAQLMGLRRFLIACVFNAISTNESFELQSTKFLGDIISDNYSSALIYKKTAQRDLLKILAQY